MQDLEKSNKTDPREIQTQTKEVNGEPFSALRYSREERYRIFRQPTLIYSVTLQKLPIGRGSEIA